MENSFLIVLIILQIIMVQLVFDWRIQVCLWKSLPIAMIVVLDEQVKLAQQRLQEIEERLPGILKVAEDLKIRLKVNHCPGCHAIPKICQPS